ncbi:MAG: beta-hydroxyacyl-ACP dehydratase [bacterium]|nr:beta-hydroxyacyl-ACP dehydratase [bacterium]
MPTAAPLIDFESIDLSQEVLDQEGLKRFLKQRDRFLMLDGILHEDVEGKLTVGYKDIRADDWWAPDHIPGRPMFPGALQVETAAQISSYDYSAHRLDGSLDDGKFVGFGGVDNCRFRRLVQPDCRMIFAIYLAKHSRRMFRYQAQGFVENELVFEAEILGVLV